MRDKRKFLRVTPKAEAPIEIQIMGCQTLRGIFLEVLHARDISVGGIGIFVPHNFKGCDVSHQVELIITLPANPPFKAVGRVIHKNSTKDGGFFGVQFLKIGESAHRAIANYVSIMATRDAL